MRGREDEVIEISGALMDRDTRLVTLTGLPGAGRSRLAHHVAGLPAVAALGHSTILNAGDDGEPLVDPADLASAAGLGDVHDTGSVTDQGVARLVIVERVDGLPGAAEMIESIVETCSSVKLMVTSRSPLHLSGEHVVRVRPFPPVGRSAPARRQRAHAAVGIYLDVAAANGMVTPVDDATMASISAVCDQLGGLPLAIELVATRVAAFSPSTVRAMLEDPPSAVDRSVSPIDALLATIPIRFDDGTLSPAQARLLMELGVFWGSVPWQAIAMVTGNVDLFDDLARLVELHFVEVDHRAGSSAYRLHPLVRRAATRVGYPESPRSVQLSKAHCNWATRFVEEAAGSSGRAALAEPRIHAVDADLRVALDRAIDADEDNEAAILVIALAPVWFERGVTSSELSSMRAAHDLVFSSPGDIGHRALVGAWWALLRADSTLDGRDLDAIKRQVDDAVDLARRCSSTVLVSVLAVAVQTARVTADWTAAVPRCEEGLQLARSHSDHAAVTRFEIWSGMLAHQEDRLDDATASAWRAVAHARLADHAQLQMTAAGFVRTLPIPRQLKSGVASGRELVALAEEAGLGRTVVWLRAIALVEELQRGGMRAAAELVMDLLAGSPASGTWMVSGMPTMALVLLAEMRGDDSQGARFAGVVAARFELLRPTLPRSLVDDYELAVRRLRDRLGPETFERCAAAGAVAVAVVAADEANAYASAVVAADGTRVGETAVDWPLSARESEVVELLATGCTNRQIAVRLGISPKTVMHHTSSIYRKLGVRGRAETIAWLGRVR